MASEEERRAAILAEEYGAFAAGSDDDDEVEFDPANFDDDEGDASSGSDDEDEGGEEKPQDYAVLTGSVHLNDEGRVICAGTWCMKSELDKEEAAAAAVPANGGGGEHGGGGSPEKPPLQPQGGKKKKPPKFKLKSQSVCHAPPLPNNGNDGNGKSGGPKPRGVLFDVRRPTLTRLPPPDGGAADFPTRRTMIFDGFFFEPVPEGALPSSDANDGDGKRNHPHGKKIKERDVEVFFTTSDHGDHGANGNEVSEDGKGGNLKPQAGAAVEYRISGRGHNEYGPFVLDGTYVPPPTTETPDAAGGNGAEGVGEKKEGSKHHHHKHAKGPCATVVFDKTYGVGGTAKATRSVGRRYDDDDDSADDDFDDKAEYGEVSELYEDATLSIEELRRKYYGGGGGGGEEEAPGDGGGKVAATVKRPRLEDSDDDECGF